MNEINPRNFKFCPVCGDRLKEKYLGEEQHTRLVCPNCGFIFYMNPTPAVAVILFRDEKILLVKRKFKPKIGDWTLPAGFMEYDETSEETAIRETKEETNLDIEVKNLFAVLPGFDDSRVHVVLIIYNGEILGGDLKPGDDASDVRFFSLDDLPGNIAFSAHREVLEMLLEKADK
ncbi:NUDIX hydrolase [candidate division KSB1 bacterium]|nr:NUDIX hydrolase [candidate division KSB1 bacterium]MBL7094597.1 NUDIX hydrolase [candidate division KSB1 bacterium]